MKGFVDSEQTLRLLPRLVLSVLFFLLPLTSEDQIDSTQLVSIGAGLALLVVAWEVFGSLERNTPLFESWSAPEFNDQQDEGVPILQPEDHRSYDTIDPNP